MSGCSCGCCAAGARCARVLVLSSRDETAAARVSALCGSGGGLGRAAPAGSSERRLEPPEPTEPVQCRGCARPFLALAWIAAAAARWGVRMHCEGCR